MARRKKRKNSGDGQRPPLVFTDSPVSIVHGVPSPVFCSDHPPTADVVVIEDNFNYSWVSPQFTRIPQSNRARRGRKRNYSGNTTSTRRLRNRSGKEAHNTSTGSLPKGMVPLRFVGQENSPPPSPIQELSMSEDDQVQTATDNGRAVTRSSGTLRQMPKSSSRDANRLARISPSGDGGGACMPPPELCTPEACNIDTGSHLHQDAKIKTRGGTKIENISKHTPDIDSANHAETGASDISSPGVAHRKLHKTRFRRISLKDRTQEACSKENEFGRKMLCKCPKSCNVHKNTRTSDDQWLGDINITSPCLGTQKRPQPTDSRHTAKRLFHNGTPVGSKLNRDINIQSGMPNSDSEPNISSRVLVSADSVVPVCNKRRLSARLASNIFLQDSLFRTPKQRSDVLPMSVLAYDTPEEDYGVSVREKQLRRLSKLKRAKLKC